MEIKNLEDLLRGHPFFAKMEEDQLKFLAGCGQNVHFRPNETIFRHNTPADSFYVIRSGRVAVDTPANDRGPITIQTLDEGDVLGWSWLFPPYRWHFHARAMEEVRAIAMDAKCLRGKIEGDHALGYDLIKRFCAMIIARLNATQLQLLDIYGDGEKA